MSSIILVIATIAVLIGLNALYVAAEFSSVASRRTRVSQLASANNRVARLLLPILEDGESLDRFVATCQIGITASSLVLGAYGQNELATRLSGPLTSLLIRLEPWLGWAGVDSDQVAAITAASLAVVVVLFFLTLLQVVLGELFPKSVAILHPERVALATVVPVRWSQALLRPFIWLLNGSGELVLKLLGVRLHAGIGRAHSPEEIEILVAESHEGGLLDDEERQMLRNAFRLRELTARQVMLHRTRIVAAPAGSTVEAIMRLALDAGHTRIPLYQETIDSIIGFVHIKDLFRLHVAGHDNLAEILREVIHVPETMPIVDVWRTLKSNHQYMAIVFDEFGGTAGLITFEDLIEEIFGELQDEFDDETALIAVDAEGRMYLRGDLLVSDVNEYLGLELPDTADTLGGLIFSLLGRPPETGEEVTVDDTVLRVEAMEDLSVTEVSIPAAADLASQLGDWEIRSHE